MGELNDYKVKGVFGGIFDKNFKRLKVLKIHIFYAIFGRMREPFAHCYGEEVAIDEDRLFARLKITLDEYDMEFESVTKLIEKYFVKECGKSVNEVFGDSFEIALQNVIARKDDESPRSYGKGVLRK